MRAFFVISSIRSGSTGIAAMFDSAINCICGNEILEGAPFAVWSLLNDPDYSPDSWIEKIVKTQIEVANENGFVYGQKYPLIYPLIPHLYEKLRCKFVYLVRDGRDVVRSMLNWNRSGTGTVYRECKEPEDYVGRAADRRQRLKKTVYSYFPDLVKPRPEPNDPLYKEWPNLSRIEMYSYYWASVHKSTLRSFEGVPDGDIYRIDMSSDNRTDVAMDVAAKLGLDTPRPMFEIGMRYNSLEDNGFGTSQFYKHWTEWTEGEMSRFNRFAAPMMKRLGYYK